MDTRKAVIRRLDGEYPYMPAKQSNAGTDIAGLDDVAGGPSRGRVFLLEGNSRTGKATIAIQFLMAGAKADKKILYITLSERDQKSTTAVPAMNKPSLQLPCGADRALRAVDPICGGIVQDSHPPSAPPRSAARLRGAEFSGRENPLPQSLPRPQRDCRREILCAHGR